MTSIIMKRISRNLIAPCGMDCGVCIAHLREKNSCPGCRMVDDKKPKTRALCKIKNCKERKGRYCFDCSTFPCDRLKALDKRYRTKYGMSELENLDIVHREGINSFIKRERKKWQSSKGILCVHDKKNYPE
jgi:hypothetical protein